MNAFDRWDETFPEKLPMTNPTHDDSNSDREAVAKTWLGWPAADCADGGRDSRTRADAVLAVLRERGWTAPWRGTYIGNHTVEPFATSITMKEALVLARAQAERAEQRRQEAFIDANRSSQPQPAADEKFSDLSDEIVLESRGPVGSRPIRQPQPVVVTDTMVVSALTAWEPHSAHTTVMYDKMRTALAAALGVKP